MKGPSLSWRPTAGSPFSCLPRSWLGKGPQDSLRGGLHGPGSRGRNQDPCRLRTGTFPLQRRLLPGLLSTQMDHTVRAGWQASPVPPPLPLSPGGPGSQILLTRVASSPAPFCLLPPLSCLQGIKRIARQGHNDPLPSHESLQSSCNTLSPFNW